MTETAQPNEVRVVVEVDDVAGFAELLGALGLRELARFGEQDQQAVLLEADRATIEIGNRAHLDHIDQLEVGRATGQTFRLALSVGDVEAATRRMADDGQVDVEAPPTPMPWGSVNARVTTDHGLQITLFEQREPERF